MIIRGHKKINEGLIKTADDKGIALKTFYCLIERFNMQEKYEDLILTKSELWNLSGYSGKYDNKNIRKLIEVLTRSETYFLQNKHIVSGSMFVTEIMVDGRIKIEVPRTYQKYVFNRSDINAMHKVKRKLPMNVEELDYYDKEVKPKAKELVLLNKAHILGLKGKYNTRLYTLLKQWDSTGKYEKSWKEFKEIMEIPQSYIVSMIDKRILEIAKIELLKANIEITDIEKVKKGRSIDKIIIRFKNLEKVEDKKEVIKEVEESKALSPEEVLVEKTLTKLFLKINGYTLRDLGDVEINSELREFIEENK